MITDGKKKAQILEETTSGYYEIAYRSGIMRGAGIGKSTRLDTSLESYKKQIRVKDVDEYIRTYLDRTESAHLNHRAIVNYIDSESAEDVAERIARRWNVEYYKNGKIKGGA